MPAGATLHVARLCLAASCACLQRRKSGSVGSILPFPPVAFCGQMAPAAVCQMKPLRTKATLKLRTVFPKAWTAPRSRYSWNRGFTLKSHQAMWSVLALFRLGHPERILQRLCKEGAIAQMVERALCMQRAVGSTPANCSEFAACQLRQQLADAAPPQWHEQKIEAGSLSLRFEPFWQQKLSLSPRRHNRYQSSHHQSSIQEADRRATSTKRHECTAVCLSTGQQHDYEANTQHACM